MRLLPCRTVPALLALATCGLLAGCAGEPVSPPAAPTPAAFEHTTAPAARWPSRDWYRNFGSGELDSLAQQAEHDNWDLAAARERVVQADMRARQAGAALLPSLAGVGAGSYMAGHSGQGSGHELDWAALLHASYETDFWGRNHALARAAARQADAARAERDAAALTLLGAVADEYFQVLALRERLQLAASDEQAARQVLAVVQARFAAGAVAPADLAAQRAALDAAQLARTALQGQEIQARAALALLLGRPPERFDVQGRSLQGLAEPRVAPGLPSQLLTRRPDLALAEANLQAARANLAAARAAMFPNLSLTLDGGVQNPALPGIVTTIPGAGPSLAVGTGLVQPIFDHGLLGAQRDEAAARERELLAQYRGAIVAALVDVENALSALQQLQRARVPQQDSLLQDQRAFDGARARYQAGAGDLLALLDAQRSLFAARDLAVQYRLARLQTLVALCKALGGGWNEPDASHED